MKKINVEYGTDGRIVNLTDDAVHYEQENFALCIEAKIPTDKSVRGYIKASNGNSDVKDVVANEEGVYTLVIEDTFMAKGTLYVGFESFDDSGRTERFEPLKVYVDGFISLGDGNTDNVYVVTIEAAETVTLPPDAEAFVENIGTKKNARFKFGIPKGSRGEKGETGEKGDKGDKGEKGVDGHTPLKGIDYFTSEEIEQFKSMITTSVKENINLEMYQRTGAKFTFDGKTYILMDCKEEMDGKTYYGVLRAKSLADGSWSYPVDGMYLKNPYVSATGTEYVSLYKGINTDVQSLKEEHFGGFGKYVIDDSFEWSFGKKADGRILAVKGSVGIPTFEQLANISKTDKQSHNMYYRTITRKTLLYDGNVYVDFFDDAPVDRGILTYNEELHFYSFLPHVYVTDWYLMTFVSEDFFKNVPLNLHQMGAYAKLLMKNNFSYDDLKNTYNPGELEFMLGISGGDL